MRTIFCSWVCWWERLGRGWRGGGWCGGARGKGRRGVQFSFLAREEEKEEEERYEHQQEEQDEESINQRQIDISDQKKKESACSGTL